MTTTDGSAKFKIKDMRTHHMCGEIVALVTIPPDYEHLLLCDGQTISADDYPELVAALGSNVLPNLNGRVLQGGSTAGEYKEAGLPNITSHFPASQPIGMYWADDRTLINVANGCLSVVGSLNEEYHEPTNWLENTPGRRPAVINVDASRSNPIYGASSTVQPPAYTVRYYICYG